MKKKGTLKKIFKFISDVISWTCLCILILIGICIIWYIIQTKVYASKGEKYKPYFSLYTIISPSMEPKIKVYDVILDTRVDSPDEIRVGDIITFVSTSSLSQGMIITHRVVDIINENGKISYVTKGDNNEIQDGAAAPYENVLGKTILKIPMLGRVQFLLANKGVWIIVVMIPALGIIAYDILKLFKNSNLKTRLENMVDDEPKQNKEKQKEDEEKRKEEIKEKLLLKANQENMEIENSDDFNISELTNSEDNQIKNEDKEIEKEQIEQHNEDIVPKREEDNEKKEIDQEEFEQKVTEILEKQIENSKSNTTKTPEKKKEKTNNKNNTKNRKNTKNKNQKNNSSKKIVKEEFENFDDIE